VFESPLSEHPPKKSISEVKISGEWKTYGLMSSDFRTPYPKGKYLGTSHQIKIDDSEQKPLKVEYHFWMKIEK
jgi:hypothetical protein